FHTHRPLARINDAAIRAAGTSFDKKILARALISSPNAGSDPAAIRWRTGRGRNRSRKAGEMRMGFALARRALLSTALSAGLVMPATQLLAQESAGTAGAQEPVSGPVEAVQSDDQVIVITGSRIRRSATDTVAPVVSVDQQLFTDRGFVSASDALNQITSIAPALALSPADGDSSGS